MKTSLTADKSSSNIFDGIEVREIFNVNQIRKVQDQIASPYRILSLLLNLDGTLMDDFLNSTQKVLYDAFIKGAFKTAMSGSLFVEKNEEFDSWCALIPLRVNDIHIANWFIAETEYDKPILQRDVWFNKIVETIAVVIDFNSQMEYDNLLLKRENSKLKGLITGRSKNKSNYRLFNTADEGLIIVQEGKVKLFSSIASRITGYSETELTEMNFANLVDSSDIDYLYYPPRKLTPCKNIRNSTPIHLIRKDRNLVLVEISRYESVWRAKSCLFYFFTNISVQKRCFEYQKPMNLFCFTVLKNTHDGIIVLDSRENLVFASPSALQILGVSETDVSDFNSLFKLYPEDQDIVFANLALTIDNPSYIPTIKFRVNNNLGEILWLESTFSNLLKNPNINAIIINFRDITESIQKERELQNALIFQKELLNTIPVPIFYKDINGCYIGANRAFVEQFGIKIDQLVGKTAFDILPPEVAELTHESDLELLITGERMCYETVAPFADGSLRNVTFNKAVFKNVEGQTAGIIGALEDLTERNALIKSISRSSRLYSLLSQINQAIVRSKKRKELFTAICDVAIDFGGFRFAWIGLLDDETNVVPSYFSGYEDGYLKDIQINLLDQRRGNGIAGKSFRLGQIVTSSDIETDPNMEPWREKALARGYRSSAGVPFCCNGVVIGVLLLYSSESGFFTNEEVALLQEISEDISFALDSMAVEAARTKIEEDLRINNTRLAFAMEASNMAWWMMDIDTGFITFDPRKAEMLGYSPENFRHYKDFMALLHPDDAEMVMENMREHILGNTDKYEVEYRILTFKGDYKWYYDIGCVVLRSESGTPLQISGIVIDISERKQNEIIFFQKEELLRESQIVAGLGGFMLDFITETWKGSEVLDKIMGFKVSTTHTIQEWLDLIHIEDRQRMHDYFVNEVLGKRQRFDAVYQIVRVNDKTMCWVHGLGELTFNKDGILSRMSGTIQDITAHKKIEDELYEREQRYSAIFNENSAVMLILDPKTMKIVDANSAACTFYGYEKDVLLAMSISDINILPTENIKVNFNQSLGRQTNHFFFQHRLASGVIRNVEVYSGPIKLNDTNLIYSIVHDITDRVEAETKMIKTSALLKSIMESSPDIIIGAFDTSYRYISFNKKYKEIMKLRWGIDIELGMNMCAVLAPHPKANVYKAVYDRVLLGESFTEVEETIYDGGERIQWLNYWSPIKSEYGAITGITSFVLNITEQKNAEVLKNQNEELTTANADKDRFISILAHDLRTPFNSILGYLQLLTNNLRNYSYDEIEGQLSTITLSAKQAHKLLEDVLIWARTQAGRLSYEPAKWNLSSIINEVVSEFKANAAKKSIIIEHTEFAADLFVIADINMLKTILRNFMSNAIKFTDIGGGININAIVSSEHVKVSVSDTGVGMSEDKLTALFELKQNQTTLGTNNEKGNGLGLLLCKEFIEKHGGSLSVESKLGEGSTFYFTMPIYHEIEIELHDDFDTQMLDGDCALELVALIVEKKDDSFGSSWNLLKPYCSQIISTESGIEAIDICKHNPHIDLILLDLHLSDSVGYEVVRHLREGNEKAIIIAQTDFAVAGVADKAINAGCNEYFPKPYKQIQFAALINKYFTFSEKSNK